MKGASRSGAVMQVWEGLARVHTAMTAAVERDMVPAAGMPLAWYDVLRHLSRSPGGMLRYQDLAKVEGITDSGASRRLQQMTKAGLINRRSCPTDRRGVFAHITTKGEHAYERAHLVLLNSLERNFGGDLKTADAELISAALERLPLA